MRRAVAILLTALALAGCDGAPPPLAEGGPRPALWEVRSEGGEVEGWLFGTIHALPEDMRWQSARLHETIDAADLLVVEVSDLQNDAAIGRIFNELAFDDPTIPLRERVSLGLRDEYDSLLAEAGSALPQLDAMESWAAALALAQMVQDGDQELGADRFLIEAFGGRQVLELEGAQAQLALFDGLPEKEQRDLIDAVIVEATAGFADPESLAESWRRGDVAKLAANTSKGILADPELREVLLVGRNRAWTGKLQRILAGEEKPLVAVGAAHLVGPDSVTAMLEARGYQVSRVE